MQEKFNFFESSLSLDYINTLKITSSNKYQVNKAFPNVSQMMTPIDKKVAISRLNSEISPCKQFERFLIL